jgi:hypothetical protein
VEDVGRAARNFKRRWNTSALEVRENFYMDPESEMKRKDWNHSSIGDIVHL